ncbi:unnamed protein product [Schistosoma mattheei]|uniref:Uncharacterized protein n=1 Tax=Schistosoma mattheei TaxID=31246 RepID=A0A183PX83_9TREM|nr:unnamed protein product [Schistosoma mattheei]
MPDKNCSCLITFIRNGMFVLTPCIRNSANERNIFLAAKRKLLARAIILTNNES